MNGAFTSLSHEQVDSLLPSFIRGQLDTPRQRQIQEHIAVCTSCARRHREDLELAEAIEQTPAGIELLVTEATRERNRQRVMGCIDPFPAVEHRPAPARSHAPSALRSLALVASIATIALGLTLAVQRVRDDYTPAIYRTQTAAIPQPASGQQDPTFRVVFRPEATLQSIQQLLLALDAAVIGGPTEAGVYTLTFTGTSDSESEILQRLRQQPEIVLAEKSVHRDW